VYQPGQISQLRVSAESPLEAARFSLLPQELLCDSISQALVIFSQAHITLELSGAVYGVRL
jgi:hypothetical protein